MVATTSNLVLSGGGTWLALATAAGEQPRILGYGAGDGYPRDGSLAPLLHRAHAPGGPEVPIAPSFLNSLASGHAVPGLLGHSDGQDWATDLRVIEVLDVSANSARVVCKDAVGGIETAHRFSIDDASGVLSIETTLTNRGGAPFALEWCAALCLPLDDRLTRITSFGGQWAGEFAMQALDRPRGTFLLENRAGRTGHGTYPSLYLGTPQTGEAVGLAAACHLAWSGNHRLRVDTGANGEATLQMGELLLPGEMMLAAGESYRAPVMYCAVSDAGYGDVTRRLHRYAHRNLRREVVRTKPRPVHFNTWEAVYFAHSEARMVGLAEQAAALGAERFVLDDGWFGARRNERAGLGDWTVSADAYPNGLRPLVDRVHELGMEFGLWVEPEMVNPDSDLYRAHPDWVLSAKGVDQIASRHQLPLDLTQGVVTDYLFERITSLVLENDVAYLKWDMNRDIQHPGGADGRAVMHAQVRSLHALIDRIRDACPNLEIESCSSGGARADWGMLQRADRVWTSDNNDARARHAIMRGAAHFLPLAMLGNHVGPERCHITKRRFDMAYRAASAVFGHMGMELDPALESEGDRAILATAIAFYKRHRAVIHDGAHYRLETPPHVISQGCVDTHRRKALYSIATVNEDPATHPPRLRLAGLDPAKAYRSSYAAFDPAAALTPPPPVASGAVLMNHGFALRRTLPDTCLLLVLETVDG